MRHRTCIDLSNFSARNYLRRGNQPLNLGRFMAWITLEPYFTSFFAQLRQSYTYKNATAS
jgi:hypothetical protein